MMSHLQKLILPVAIPALLVCGTAAGQGAADNYPFKPVTVVAPYEPGGPIDTEARVYTKKLNEFMPQPFVIEYKTGAGTRIGVNYVAKSAPDGHTLLITTASFTIFPVLFKNLPFDTIKDFAPVSQMTQQTTAFVVRPSFPAKNFAEYIAYARANPGKVNYGMLGAGSTGHLVGAWLESSSNTKVTYVPYKGTAPELVDVVAERLDVATAALVTALPFIKSGKMRALAVMNDSRSRLLPDVPTVSEQGLPGFAYTNWTGVFAPRATPVAIVNKLGEALARVAKSPDVIAGADAHGNVMMGSTPAQFSNVVVTETARWQKLVKDAGIKMEE